MPSLVDSLGNFVSSIFGAIKAILTSILAVFQTLFNTLFDVLRTALSAVGTMISGLAQTFEGLFKFLLSGFRRPLAIIFTKIVTSGNIVVIGGVVAVIFLYGVYQQRNGRPITAAPAKNKKVN